MKYLTIIVVLTLSVASYAQSGFVTRKDDKLMLNGKPYYFVGTNYWYGSLLGLKRDKRRGVTRLRRELDFLKANGVTNLRLMAGAEGSGLLNGVLRVGPSLQPEQGKFNERVLDGLDLVLAEMAKRKMKAVIFFSNNWEWSGGFQQYLIWNGVVSKDLLTRKPEWDELRNVVAKFYTCEQCKTGYQKQAELILRRRNKITKKRYVNDPTIMAWEVANEPRPMRPAANDPYKKWLSDTTTMIRSLAPRQLITIGHEGSIGTESVELFEAVHLDKNVDYLTIHIWPKNWGWLGGGLSNGFENAVKKTEKYITESNGVAEKLNKPLVIEEFGLPRDAMSFDPLSATTLRDRYYEIVLSHVGKGKIAGANFWAFGGTARPVKGQTFWKVSDEYMGDPPMEEQGLNTVFDSDKTTWVVIRRHAQRLRKFSSAAVLR